MSEKKGTDEINVFVQAAIEGAKLRAIKTGQSLDEILKQERAESLVRHEASAEMWQKIYNQALKIIKG